MQDTNVQNLTQQPQAVAFLYCSDCGIHTNHRQTKSGTWVCWCGNEYQPPAETRRDFILYELSQGRGELTDEVIDELAEYEASRDTMNSQLYDAGYYGDRF